MYHECGLMIMTETTIVTYILKDKNGKILSKKSRKSRSFVIAYSQLLREFCLGRAYGLGIPVGLSIVDTGGTTRTSDTTPIASTVPAMLAPAALATYGIVVGTGTNAVTNNDYALQTQIAHGNGAGQLSHSNTTITSSQVVGINVDCLFSRTFANNTAGTIIVNEAGCYVSARDTGVQRYYCIVRDVQTQPILPGQSLTVQYTFRTAA